MCGASLAIPSFLLALMGRDREKGGHFLFDILASAMRALDWFVIVLVERQDFLKGFMAVMADIIVNGHDVLLRERSD